MGLMAGNTIILKVDTCTTLIGQFRIEEIIASAQLPNSLFSHIVGGGPEVSRRLIDSF